MHATAHRGALRSRAVRICALLTLVLAAGCGDVLAVAGLSNLGGFWVGRYDSDFDFYLELDDDILGTYGKAGLIHGSSSTEFYVDGERDGSRIRFYRQDRRDGEGPVFEGEVTGRDRITGFAYLEVLPRRVTLYRD